jgi:4-amino-4-deoxy-L-arabinose transferase-like glycosyltransferase
LATALPESPTRGYWIALIGTAVLLRIIVSFVVLGSMPIFSDAKNYSGQAVDLLHGRTHLPYYWPPGTSYVLAAGYWLFGIHRWVAHLAMLVLNVGAVITTVLLARRLLRNERAALLAGWILALYPGMIMQVSQPDSFDPALVGVNLTALFALRAWDGGRLYDYAAAGVGLGFAALTRPSTLSLLLGLAILAAAAIRRRQEQGLPTGLGRVAIGSAALVACTAATVAPAVAHNIVNHQGPTISVNNELNTWLGNNPYTPNYKTDDIGQHPVGSFPPDEQRYLRRFIYGEIPTRAQRSADLDEAKRFVEHHPAISLWRTLNRIRGFWGFEYSISNTFRVQWGKGAKAEGVGLIFEAGGYCVLAMLTIIGLLFARDLLRPGGLWFLAGLVAAFELPYALVYGAGRWHYPVLGLLAVIAGAGTAWLIETPDRWQRIRASTALWVVIAVFVLVQIEYGYYLVRPG